MSKRKLARFGLYGFCGALLALTLAPSCKEDDTEEKQRESIERYITNTLRAEVDERDGVYYVPVKPEKPDTISGRRTVEAGDSVTLEYEAMTLSGVLFATSDTITAREKGLEPLPATDLEVGSGKLIAGLDRGLLRMAHGEQAILLFPFTLGYGKEYVGLVPSTSALVFNVLVKEVNKQ
ncbi:MAG: FKBP-type peptidyl-prolyl cis-trans isomerase [Prevotellaceae bacterium]|jgi:FKBP-type peptidyl-prolyl cis-trans isomerase|nr:FKBP-type peptidyl-prolyl cis-trans isomerase [Prevotellaceae bacterium]